MTIKKFRQNVAFWLASHALPPDLLDHKRLQLPLKQCDPVWVLEELVKNGGPDYQQLSSSQSQAELFLLTRKTKRSNEPSRNQGVESQQDEEPRTTTESESEEAGGREA